MLFHVIDDAQIVLRTKGVYRQAKLYRRGQYLYAGYGGGFIAVKRDNGTSHPNVSWDYIDGVGEIEVERGASGAVYLKEPQEVKAKDWPGKKAA